MPKPYPSEFREDVVRVARGRDPEVTLEQVAADFGVHPMTLSKWLRVADVEDGARPGMTRIKPLKCGSSNVATVCWSRRTRFCAGLRRICPRRSYRKRIYPLVTELAAVGAPIRVPVAVTCRVLKLHRQHYYRWLGCPVTDTEWNEAHLADALFDAHREDPEFGYRFLADEIRAAGHEASERTIWRICSDNEWWSVFGKRLRGRKNKPGAPAHDDLVRRQFHAPTPNVVWLTDITEQWTGEGKLYLCAIKDLWSNRIVGYSIAGRMESSLAVAALDSAVARRRIDGHNAAGCILHSDRGSQFRSRKLQQALTRHGMVGSMGQVGSAGDNAAMESFFRLLQKNVLNRQTWPTREGLRIAIATWIERTYNRRRRQASLGRLTPTEYENIMSRAA